MIQQRAFGSLSTGEGVDEYTLTNARGLSLKVITYGGIVTQLHVPDREGRLADVVLGFNHLESYLAGHPYFGCITGRVAGRLTRGIFSLDGQAHALAINDPPNHLHGGRVGFDKRVWKAEVFREGRERLQLSYHSPDGEEGYPGNVRVSVTYSLTDSDEFVIAYEGVTDRATPLNLTHHGYFNLAGEGSGPVGDQLLQIFAGEYAPTDDAMTLLGRREPVAGRANDFTRPRRIGDVLADLWKRHGDLYFVHPRAVSPPALVARLWDPSSGREMTISSTEPCLQLYTGVSLDGTLGGKSGVRYGPHSALCLECQGYPGGIDQPHLGDIVLRPGFIYRQTTRHAFSIAESRAAFLDRH